MKKQTRSTADAGRKLRAGSSSGVQAQALPIGQLRIEMNELRAMVARMERDRDQRDCPPTVTPRNLHQDSQRDQAQPQAQPPIAEELRLLGMLLDGLSKEIGTLTGKLAPFSIGGPPVNAPVAGAVAPTPQLSAVECDIRCIRGTVERLTSAVIHMCEDFRG